MVRLAALTLVSLFLSGFSGNLGAQPRIPPNAATASPRVTLDSATSKPRAVFELFTSQGCESCLSADNLLTSYAQTGGDVIALTYPVTIWDHLGWRDTLARPEYTQRQRGYASMLGNGKIYTPQMVINGVSHSIGSDQGAIEKKCTKKGSALRVPVGVSLERGTLDISIASWPDTDEPPRARVYLVSYLKQRSVPIERGENAGKTATYTNVVQSVREIAYWHGENLDLRVFWRPAEQQGGAILLQSISQQGPGVIYGAAALPNS